jgi:HD-GYP domain-containing protein (c-di-GMP phosphodiesterase class II)
MGHIKSLKPFAVGRAVCKPATLGIPAPLRTAAFVPVATAAKKSDDFSINESEGILFALAQAVEQRDRQTAGHCERLAFIGAAIGMAMRLDRPQLQTLYRGGYLHDVGKVGIPDSILYKPGVLTADEWVVMRSHTTRGEEICRPLASLDPVLPVIRHHHERWDGAGYPDGLRGDQIPLLARIIQVADIYDALISERPYKKALLPVEALSIIQQETDCGWRDPEIVGIFMRLHEKVISRIAEYTGGSDRNLDAMRGALASLQNLI